MTELKSEIYEVKAAFGNQNVGSIISRLIDQHLTTRMDPFWTPIVDIPGVHSVQEVLGLDRNIGDLQLFCSKIDGLNKTDLFVLNNGEQARIFLEAGPFGNLIDVRIKSAQFVPIKKSTQLRVKPKDARTTLDALVVSHKKEKKTNIFLELPPNFAPENFWLKVTYTTDGKERHSEGGRDIQMREFTPLSVYRSMYHGGTPGQHFDDIAFLRKHPGSVIHKIEVWASSFVFGLQVTYRDSNTNKVTGKGVKSYSKSGYYGYSGGQASTKSFTLVEGEFINQVTIRSGEIVDGFQLGTNYGRIEQFGGLGGTHHDLLIPANHQVLGFFGGLSSVMARMGVFSKIVVSQQELDLLEEMILISLPDVLTHIVKGYVGFDIQPIPSRTTTTTTSTAASTSTTTSSNERRR